MKISFEIEYEKPSTRCEKRRRAVRQMLQLTIIIIVSANEKPGTSGSDVASYGSWQLAAGIL